MMSHGLSHFSPLRCYFSKFVYCLLSFVSSVFIPLLLDLVLVKLTGNLVQISSN